MSLEDIVMNANDFLMSLSVVGLAALDGGELIDDTVITTIGEMMAVK